MADLDLPDRMASFVINLLSACARDMFGGEHILLAAEIAFYRGIDHLHVLFMNWNFLRSWWAPDRLRSKIQINYLGILVANQHRQLLCPDLILAPSFPLYPLS